MERQAHRIAVLEDLIVATTDSLAQTFADREMAKPSDFDEQDTLISEAVADVTTECEWFCDPLDLINEFAELLGLGGWNGPPHTSDCWEQLIESAWALSRLYSTHASRQRAAEHQKGAASC